ncbi:hypothetical protein TL16_g11513 [Triparma laevis f. inornata]|uniref:Uncharacterized protein n=1 Tax=Triparma laevis f. inornata TaxID=1714386 RepID=A0A9W7BFK2_9STRA|nr:hypothetical protein TL16_g11513 [Triparma laevis f. inornata]
MSSTKTSTEHKSNLTSLSGRLESRRELKRTLTLVESEKKRKIQENTKKKEFLASLPHHLQSINEASAPLRKYLKLSTSNLSRDRYDTARTVLCKELYVVFCNLVSAGEDVECVECEKFDGKVKGWFDERGGEEYKAEEVSMKNFVRKKQHTFTRSKKITNVKHVYVQVEVLRPHANSVEWKLSGSEVVKFNYLPSLQIITVQSPTPMRNLFPHDTGIDTPNDTNHHTFPDHNNGYGIILPPRSIMSARPFVWAQWVGGMYFCVKKGTRVEPSVRTVVRMVKMRVRAYGVLGKVLGEIGGMGKAGNVNSLPLHPNCDWLTETSATLNKWEEVTEEKEEDEEEEQRVFTCIVKAGGEELNCKIFVGIDYPIRAPQFEFTRGKGKNATNADGNLKELEREINTRYEALADNTLEDGMDFILTHQIRRLCGVWEKIATGKQWGSIGGVRVRKGKDRKKVIAFD